MQTRIYSYLDFIKRFFFLNKIYFNIILMLFMENQVYFEITKFFYVHGILGFSPPPMENFWGKHIQTNITANTSFL